MVNCPDCEDKDKIVIAGRVFCANCGTPWQPSNATGDKVASGDAQKATPALSTAQKLPNPPAPTQPQAKPAPPVVQKTILPTISKTSISTPKATPIVAKKIDNIEDRLKASKQSGELISRANHQNESIVKEIAQNLATVPQESRNIIASEDLIKPIIPHSPIGDIKDGSQEFALNIGIANQQSSQANPMQIDTRMLSENAEISNFSPIPSERIAEVIDQVITSRQPVKQTSPTKVLSDRMSSLASNKPSVAQTNNSPQVITRNREQKYISAATVPRSAVINKFQPQTISQANIPQPANVANQTTRATIAPPPLPPPKPNVGTQLGPNNIQKSQTFSELANTIPIQQNGPINVATGDNTAVIEQASEDSASTAVPKTNLGQLNQNTLDQLTNLVGSVSDPSRSTVTSQQPSIQPQDDTAESQPAISAATVATTEDNDNTEHIGSEIISLDTKDESVISDNEFNELARTSPTVSASNSNVDSVTQAPQSSVKTTEPINANSEAATRPKAFKPIDTAAVTKPSTSAQTTSNVANRAEKVYSQNTITTLPPSPDGITPGVSFHPSHAIDYPVMKVKPAEAETEDRPLTEEEALKLVHKKVAEEANLPKPKVGHSFSASTMGLSIVGLFLVGAYIWQINYPNLAFKVAASKAGISASSPGYIPSGWKLSNNIKTSPGVVSYDLQSDGNKRQVAITESKTDWDSQALAENYIASKSPNYLALQAQGLTIYVYGNNQASWINRGNWYRIEGQDHGLSQDQIIKIATSL